MARSRWGTQAPPEGTEVARQRLIDAAETCFTRYGVGKTTVEDVANEASVSRATVYRYFSDRDELILGVLMRKAGRYFERLARHLETQPGLAEAVVEGVVFTIESVRGDQHLAMLFSPEAVGITSSVAGTSEALFTAVTAFLRPLFERGRETGELRSGIDIDEAAEWVLRTLLSLLATEGRVAHTPHEQRHMLRNFLLPAILENPPSPSLMSPTASWMS